MSELKAKGNSWRLGLFLSSDLDDLGLDPFEFRVYANLCRRANDEARCWPSVGNIAKVCCMGATRVKVALRSLADRGLIVIEHTVSEVGGQGSNNYLIHGPVGATPRRVATPPQACGDPPPSRSDYPPRRVATTPPGVWRPQKVFPLKVFQLKGFH